MNQEYACDVARDLMPLEMDGVCSEGSQKFLKSHLEACAPCREIYAQMKPDASAIFLPPCPEENPELGSRVRKAGKRLQRLYRFLSLCGVVMFLFLGLFTVQTLRWNHIAKAPLDSYEITLSSYEDFVHVDLAYSFTNLHGVVHNLKEETDGAVITYYVEYYPVRARSEQLISPAYRTLMLSGFSLCLKDGVVYTIDQDSIPFFEPEFAGDVSAVYLTPDLPVSEIRVTDGKETRVIYTRGDELPEKRQPSQGEGSGLIEGIDIRVGE